MKNTLPIAITADIDWAPDFMIRYMREHLERADVPATFFVTHTSTETSRLVESDLFETGPHPNFMPGSSHGETVDDVIRFCRDLDPDGTSFRTHGLVQSSALLSDMVKKGGYAIDCSILLPRASWVEPVTFSFNGTKIMRLPFTWEDDVEMGVDDSLWRLDDILEQIDGAYLMLNFHPVHVYLNQPDMSGYRQLKNRGALPDLRPEDVEDLRLPESSPGPAALFVETISHLMNEKTGLTVTQLASKSQNTSLPTL